MNNPNNNMISRSRLIFISLPLLGLIAWSLFTFVKVYTTNAPSLVKTAERDVTIKRSEVPLRGNIMSRDGQFLAVTVPAYRVEVNAIALTPTHSGAIEPIVNMLSPVLDVSASQMRDQLINVMNKKNQSVVLAFNTPEERLQRLGVYRIGVNAWLTPTITYTVKNNDPSKKTETSTLTVSIDRFITIYPVSRREYPNGTIAAPVIGMTRYTQTNLIKGMLDGYITQGVSGLELSFDDELNGKPGIRAGRGPLERVEPVPLQPSGTLVTTLDVNVQRTAELILDQAQQKYKTTGGTIIVMDVKTGDIYAMAVRTERPALDLNKPLADLRDLANPAIDLPQQAGSVIKPLIVATAIEFGKAIEQYDDNKPLLVRGTYIRNLGGAQYGKVDLMKLLLFSINTYTAQLGLNIGPELLYKQFKALGFRDLTGIQLKDERLGVMLVKGENKDWNEHYMAIDSFGQSMTLTPLQILTAFASLGNDGVLIQPRIVREIQYNDAPSQIIPDGEKRAVFSPATAQRTLKLMNEAIGEKLKGEKALQIPGFSYAGKTGTAQWFGEKGIQETNLVLFAGLIPANEPRLAILVKLNEPRINSSTNVLAGSTALPVWRDVAEQTVRLLNISPDK
jgi:cell division protein FtsI/penicillin-binding protein 2